jgi:chromosome segregation ATPase
MNPTDQVNKIIFENEQLTASLERLRNENNIIKIELQELTLAIDNERASKRLLSTELQNSQTKVENLQKELNEVINELEEKTEKYKSLKGAVEGAEERAGCSLAELPGWKIRCLQKAEEVEVFKRELAFCKGSTVFNGLSSVDDAKTERLLAEFYAVLNINTIKIPEAESRLPDSSPLLPIASKDSSLNDRLVILEEELGKKRTECLEQSTKIKDLQNRLSVSKNIIDHLEKELGIMQKHSFLQEKKTEQFDFRRAIQNLETLDSKLKVVYSSCIDLFVHLDKNVLIQMEKKLNDCIIEFKEIRDMLLNQL